MRDKPTIAQGQAGAHIVRRDPAPRTVTSATVEHLKQGGASKELVRYAEQHVKAIKK